MRSTRGIFTVLMAVSMLFSFLSAPLSYENVVNAQSGGEYTPGWDVEITLTPYLLSTIESGEIDPVAELQAQGMQVSLEGNLLKISSTGSLQVLRNVLFEFLGQYNPLMGRAELSVSMPFTDSQTVLMMLETNLSTGYGWEFSSAEGVTAEQQGDPQYVAPTKVTIAGLPQVVIFDFGTTGTGVGKLNLVYQRPFGEPETPLTRINIRLAEYTTVVNLSDPYVDNPSQYSPPPPAAAEEIPASQPEAQEETIVTATGLDWRQAGVVPPIRDQGGCGSGWAFATVGAFESAIKKSGGPLPDLSEQFIMSCGDIVIPCSGGVILEKYHLSVKAKNQIESGGVLESDKPYLGSMSSCTVAYDHPYRGVESDYIPTRDSSNYTINVKNALTKYGPLAAYICAGPAFQHYTGGVFDTDESSYCPRTDIYSKNTNHAIMLVGWEEATQSWILRNSWGDAWGENGYMRIKWGTSNVGSGATYITWKQFETPVPTGPSGFIEDNKPTFTWAYNKSVNFYNLVITDASNGIEVVNIDFSGGSGDTCNSYLKKCHYHLTTPLEYEKSYRWKLRAINYINSFKGQPSFFSEEINITPRLSAPLTYNPLSIADTIKPEFTWQRSSVATTYHLMVYDIAASTYVIDTRVNSSSCSETNGMCSYTPSKSLVPNKSYFWKISAINGTYEGQFSPESNFRFQVPAFESAFIKNKEGWLLITGRWSLVTTGTGHYRANGIIGKNISIAYQKTFSTLDFQARMKRIGCFTCTNYLVIRGTPKPLGSKYSAWAKGYYFQITPWGYFNVSKITGNGEIFMKYWTLLPFVNRNAYNTLRVTASGPLMKFYVNGILVWSGSDSSFKSGQVGMGMWTNNMQYSSNFLDVDWARLSTTLIPTVDIFYEGEEGLAVDTIGSNNPFFLDKQ